MAFATAADIGNRACTHLGAAHFTSFTDQSAEALEIARVYDGLRLAEMEDNLWRFATKRLTLRPVSVDTVLWTPPAWVSGTSYSAGAIVSYAPVGQGIYEGETLYWQTDVDASGTTVPDADTRWRRWFGCRDVNLYDSSITYNSGEIVIVPAAYAGGTTYSKHQVVRSGTTWYVSLVDANLGNAVSDTTKWLAWKNSGRNDSDWGETTGGTPVPLTYPSCVFYLSLTSGNEDNPLATGARWLLLGGTSVALNLFSSISSTMNRNGASTIFRLPYGFLRRAPIDPRAATRYTMGVHDGEPQLDWTLEGEYIVSADAGPLVIRFVADVIDVPLMAPTFGEALAARIAAALFPRLGHERAKMSDIDRAYRRSIAAAKRNNNIEVGPFSPPLDPLISCRL